MVDGMEVRPLTLHILIGLHLHLTLTPLDAIAIIPGYEVVEH